MKRVVLSVLGHDRPGIVAAVARVLFQQNCNIENISQTILQTEFSGSFIVTLPAELRLDELREILIEELAYMFGSRVQGWIEYYCRFYRSAFWAVAHHLNRTLVRWVMRKYKRFRGHLTRAWQWLAEQAKRRPWTFPHWRAGFVPYAGPMGAR